MFKRGEGQRRRWSKNGDCSSWSRKQHKQIKDALIARYSSSDGISLGYSEFDLSASVLFLAGLSPKFLVFRQHLPYLACNSCKDVFMSANQATSLSSYVHIDK